jgi:hypothetical protein
MRDLIFNKVFMGFRITIYVSVILLFVLIPVKAIENGRNLCIIYNLFDVRCPGCGMTRAFSNAFHGDIGAAIQFNRLIIVWLPLFLILSLNDIYIIMLRFIRLKEFTCFSIVEKILLMIYKK